MSKIDELITEFCPDGVEYKEIQEVFTLKNGYTPSKSNRNYWENGTIPWFRMDDIRTNGKILNKSLQYITKEAIKGVLFPANSIIISTSATIGEHALITIDSLANQRFTYLTRKEDFLEFLDIKYFFYYCDILGEWCKNNTTKGSFNSVDMNKFRKYKFPLPPLPIQKEIVRILDSFTALTAALTAELTAEFTARKKQYEYYRDELLSFKNTDVEWRELGEIATEIYRGSGIKRDQITDEGIQCARYGEIYTVYNVWFDQCVSHTNIDKIKSKKYFEHGDILFAITGESVEEIAKSCAYVGDDKCLAGGDIVVMKHNQNPKYLAYALSTIDAQKQKSKGRVKSKVVHSSVPSLKALKIPIPSLEEQERISVILDKFDSILNDISQGLPAEIKARQKQYEFYRDKLLSFKEKECVS